MNPRTILSSRNLLGAFVVIITAAVLFAGTWLIYNEFSSAAAGDGTYSGINPAYGNNSTVAMSLAAPLDGATGTVACEAGFEARICYNTAAFHMEGSGIHSGITDANILMLMQDQGDASKLIAIFNAQNVFDNPSQVTITIGNIIGGLPGVQTINNILAPPPPAAGTYNQNQAPYGKTALLTPVLTGGGAAITTDGLTVACPAEPAYDGNTCLNTNVVTITNSGGLAEGTTIAAVVLNSTNKYEIILSVQNAVTANNNIGVRIAANNNVSQLDINTWNQQAPPEEPQEPASPTGSGATYSPFSNTFGDAIFVATFTQSLTTTGSIACPQGIAIPAQSTCFNTSNFSLTGTGLASGVSGSGAVAIVRGDGMGDGLSDKNLIVIMDQRDVVFDLSAVTMSFSSGFGGITSTQTFENIGGIVTPPTAINDNEVVYMELMHPYPYSTIPTDLQKIIVAYSGPLDESTVTTSNIRLATIEATPQVISTTSTFDAATNVILISINESLPQNKTLELSMSNLEAANNISIGDERIQLSVASDATSVAPSVTATSISANATGVDTLIGELVIQMDQPMNSPTSGSGTIISPAVDGATSHYDPRDMAIHVLFNSALAANTEYTVAINSDADASGVRNTNLYGDLVNAASLTFTTGDANATEPQLTWADFTAESISVGYNIPLSSTASNIGAWSLTCDEQDKTSLLREAAIENFHENMYFRFTDVPVDSQTSSCTITVNATGLNGVSFTGQNNSVTANTMTTAQYSLTDGDDWAWGGCLSSECTAADRWMDPMTMGWSPMEFFPSMQIASLEATETMVSFPITRALTTGDAIIVVLPSGSSINTDTLGTIGDDINGGSGAMLGGTYYEQGRVYFSASSYDQATSKLTLTVAIDADKDGSADGAATTNASDYLSFVLKGFKNGPATIYNDTNANGGAYATFKTKAASGQWLEENIGQSGPYTVMAAGGGSITGTVRNAANPSQNVQNVVIGLDSEIGYMQALTNSSGVYAFSNLPEGNYFVFAEPNSLQTTYVVSGGDKSIPIEANDLTHTNVDFTVGIGTVNVSVNLAHAGIGGDGSTYVNLMGFNTTENQFTEVKTLLDNDGATSKVLALTPGEWHISVDYFSSMVYMDTMMDDSDMMNFDFMIPEGEVVNVATGAAGLAVAINMSSSDATIKGQVLDTSGNPVAQASVAAWGKTTSSQTVTDSNGKYSLSLAGNSSYSVSASLPGSPAYQELFVRLEADQELSGYNFTLNVPSIVISGTVSGAEKSAWVQAYDSTTGFFTEAQTNSETGLYSMRVNPNKTYTVSAYSNKGQIPASGAYASNGVNTVSVTDSAISSVSFTYSESNFGSISGSVSLAKSGITVCADAYNRTTLLPTGKSSCTTTDPGGQYRISLTKNTGSEYFSVSAFGSTVGDLPPVNEIDISSSNATSVNISAGTTHTVTVNITGEPSNVTQLYFDMFNPNSYRGIGSEFKSFSSGSASKSFDVPEGSYEAMIHVPGIGEIAPDSGSSVVLAGDTTLNFTLGNISSDLTSLNITVKKPDNSALANAWVEVFEPSTGAWNGGTTNNSGVVSLDIKVTKSLTVRVDHPNSASAKLSYTKAQLTESGDLTITMGEAKNGSIAINVTNPTGKIWVDVVGDTFWNGAQLNGSGTGSISVPATGNYQLLFYGEQGSTYTKSNVQSGDTVTVAFGSFSAPEAWMATMLDNEPKIQSFTPKSGITLDDENNNNIKIAAGGNAIGTDSTQYSLKVQTVANIPKNSAFSTQGFIGKEITFKDAAGKQVTSMSGTYDLTIILTKAEAEAAKTGGSFSSWDNLSTMNLGYWDTSTNSWKSETTTRYAYVKANSGSSWTTETVANLVSNIKSNSSYYYDWKLELKSTVNHATIFSPITGSDSTAPDAPTGLAGSATSSQVVLDWNDNAEVDLLEYEIYRGTSSPVSIEDANQINVGAITASTFTDTTAAAGTTYYYAVTAVDTSSNESTSIEASVTVPAASSVAVVAVVEIQTGGGGAKSSSSPSSSDEEEEEETVTDEETPIEAGWTAEEHEETDYDSHWGKTYIEKVIDAGIAEGISRTVFEPNRDITRAEMAKMVAIAFGYDIPDSVTDSTFTDVDVTEWYARYVETAKDNGLIAGYSDNTFKPGNYINRAEAMKILIEAYLSDEEIAAINVRPTLFSDVDITAWYAPYITYAYDNQIVRGYSATQFAPGENISRAEFCKVIVNLLDL